VIILDRKQPAIGIVLPLGNLLTMVSTYFTATLVPTDTAQSITVQNGHTVTISAAATASNLKVNTGGTLDHTVGITLTISNGSAFSYDFTVDGTYILNGTQPTFGSSANCLINGLVWVKGNVGGQSDQFAASANVVFATGAIFQWDITLSFTTANTKYFFLFWF
jgi:hypothetical protein